MNVSIFTFSSFFRKKTEIFFCPIETTTGGCNSLIVGELEAQALEINNPIAKIYTLTDSNIIKYFLKSTYPFKLFRCSVLQVFRATKRVCSGGWSRTKSKKASPLTPTRPGKIIGLSIVFFSPCYLVIYLLASNTSPAKILVNEFLYICFNFSRIFISKALRITFLISFDATQHLVKLNQFIN